MRAMAGPTAPPQPSGTPERPLTVGATLVTVLLTFVAGQMIGAAVMAGAAVFLVVTGHTELAALARGGAEMMAKHPAFVSLAAATAGSTLVLATWLSLRRVRVPLRAGTGLVMPRAWHIPVSVVLIMAAGPFADLAIRAFRSLFPTVTLGVLESLSEAARTDGPLLFLLLTSISLVPGFAEELFFRGAVQRSLIGRYGGPIGIVLASILFGAFHVDPPQAVGAAVLGLMLGFVTWRTGSVVPAMVGHAANNALALAAARVAPEDTTPVDLMTQASVLGVSGVLIVGLGALLLRAAPPHRSSFA
jgi:membrane protease YdiL (CAAX protease family)